MGKEFKINKFIYPLTLILFLLIGNPYLKLAMTLIYIFSCKLWGFKIKWLSNTLLFITLIAISQFNPNGLVLLSFGFYTVTKGAVEIGIYKASLLIGTIYLSKIITTGRILLPGGIGLLLGDIFSYFNQLTSGERIQGKNIIKELDKKLLLLKNEDSNTRKDVILYKNRLLPLILTIILLILDRSIAIKLFF